MGGSSRSSRKRNQGISPSESNYSRENEKQIECAKRPRNDDYNVSLATSDNDMSDIANLPDKTRSNTPMVEKATGVDLMLNSQVECPSGRNSRVFPVDAFTFNLSRSLQLFCVSIFQCDRSISVKKV